MLSSAEISVFQKMVTFELHMLTFELRWPPFCRKKRFCATKILQNFTSSYPKKTQKHENVEQPFS